MAGRGYNGTLATADFGSYRVRCIDIGQGVNIISSEAEGSTRKVFYPVVTTSSSFGMTIAFPTYEDRERFNKWMNGFMDKMAAGRGFRATMHITVPAREFTRDAVPTGPIQYGEGIRDVGYTTNLSFVGASEPLDINKSTRKVRSYFQFPKKNRGTSKFFYPMGTQLTGLGELAGSIYDTFNPPEDVDIPFNPFDNEDDNSTDSPFNPFD